MKKGTLLRSPLWPGNPQPRMRRLKTVGGIALMATLVGCGFMGPEPAFVVRGTVLAGLGSDPSVRAQPLEGASVWLSVRHGGGKLGFTPYTEVLATAISDVEGRFELQTQPNKRCDDGLGIEPTATIYLGASKAGYHRLGDTYPQHQGCSGLVSVVVRLEPESDLNFVSQPSASEASQEACPSWPGTICYEFADGYVCQQEQCLAHSPGTIYYRFSDGYVWLITTSLVHFLIPSGQAVFACGRRSGGFYEGQKVEVAVCDQFEYHHVIGTDLIAQVLLNP